MSNVLELSNLNLQIANKLIINNISFNLKKGDFLVLLGSNGCGKSSLLKLIYKQFSPTAGSIIFNGQNILRYDGQSFYQKIKFLNQDCNDALFTQLTVLENFKLITKDYKLSDKAIASYLSDFNPNLKAKLNNQAGTLSGGEKQALALALFMFNPPDLLLLDEHTSALDPNSANKIMELTNNIITTKGITCIMTTHNLNLAKHYGNKIMVMKEGNVCTQTQDKAILDASSLVDIYC